MADFGTALAWHLGALGDVVLATPALRALGRVARRVEILATPARGELLRRGAACHAAHDGTRADLAPLFVEGGAPPAWLRDRLGGDSLVVLFFHEAEVLARNLAPRAGRVIVVPPRPPAGAAVHCADWLLRGVAARIRNSTNYELRTRAGAGARPRIRVDAASREEARARLEALARSSFFEPRMADEGFLVLHPGSGGAAKRLPASIFLEIAARARESLGLDPLFILGPVEAEHPGLLAGAHAARIPVIESPPLPALAALLSLARAYVGNDSGPTHLAAAVGAPVLALFGNASDPRVFAPRGRGRVPVRILHAPLGCLTAEAILAQVQGLLVTGR